MSGTTLSIRPSLVAIVCRRRRRDNLNGWDS